MYQQMAKDGVSEAYVAPGGQVLGSIRFADVLASRSEERRRLHERNGNENVSARPRHAKRDYDGGRELGVDEAFGELLLDQRAQWVSRLRANNRKVAMVGDGINEVPALVQANIRPGQWGQEPMLPGRALTSS